jgi:hypothetical protein
MPKKLILVTISILLAASFACAEDHPLSGLRSVRGKVLPSSNEGFENAAQAAVNNKNVFGSFDKDISKINYDESGRIGTVVYEDGMKVTYSYSFDDKGNMAKCTLSANNEVVMEFREIDKGLEMKAYQSSSEKKSTEPVVVIIPGGGQDLEDLSRTPVRFDFNKIKEALDDTAQAKNEAYETYIKNTQPYYEKVAAELKVKSDSLKADGVDINKQLNRYENSESPIAKKREAVDEAVALIRAEASEKPAAGKFLAAEGEYDTEFLSAGKEIYSDRVKKAMEYVNAVIDDIVSSNIAVYMNKKKGKIDAIIKLPQKSAE